MRVFTCASAAGAVFLAFCCPRWLHTKGPWFCSKGISFGICSYLYTKLHLVRRSSPGLETVCGFPLEIKGQAGENGLTRKFFLEVRILRKTQFLRYYSVPEAN
jgi:hypothetical protein